MTKSINYFMLGFLFLTLSFYTTFIIRNNFDHDSIFVFIFVIIVCISTDIGGFLFGKIFQGPKLTIISPKKTYSGVLGSYIVVILTVYLLTINSNLLTNTNFYFDIKLFVISFLISTISQLGDITISYFKRLSKIKDTGNLIPGHGGILDRIDGMIFAFPFFYFFNLIYKFI